MNIETFENIVPLVAIIVFFAFMVSLFFYFKK